MKRATRLYTFQYINHVARRDAQCVQSGNKLTQAGSSAHFCQTNTGFFNYCGLRTWHNDSLARRKGVGLGYKWLFLDTQCQVALTDGNTTDANVLAHHNCA